MKSLIYLVLNDVGFNILFNDCPKYLPQHCCCEGICTKIHKFWTSTVVEYELHDSALLNSQKWFILPSSIHKIVDGLKFIMKMQEKTRIHNTRVWNWNCRPGMTYSSYTKSKCLEGCLTVHLPHEIMWNANLMQLGNFIDVFLARHFWGIYAHHQEH